MGNNDILFRLNAEDAGMGDAVKVITRYNEQLETQLGKVTKQQKEHTKELQNFRELGELVFGSAGVIMGGVALLKTSLSEIGGEITRISDSFRNIANLRTQAITATPMPEGVKFDQKFSQERLTAYAEKLRRQYPAISPSMVFEEMKKLQTSTAGGYKPEEAIGLMSALGNFSNIQQFPAAMGIGAQLKKAYPNLSNDDIKAQVAFVLKYAGLGRQELEDVKQAQFQELASFGVSAGTATQLVAAAASKFQTRKIQAFIEKMANPEQLLNPAESKTFQSFIDSGDVVDVDGKGTYRPKISGDKVSRAGEIATKYYLGDEETRQSMLYGKNKDEVRRILFGSASDDTLKKVLLVKALKNMTPDARLNFVINGDDETKRILLGDGLTVIKPALDLAKTLESPLAELKKDPKKFTAAYFASTESPSTNILAEADAQKAKAEALDLAQGQNALTLENIKNGVLNRIREKMGTDRPNFFNYWLPIIQADLAMGLSQAFPIQPETVGAIGETASDSPISTALLEAGAGILGGRAMYRGVKMLSKSGLGMKNLMGIPNNKNLDLMAQIFEKKPTSSIFEIGQMSKGLEITGKALGVASLITQGENILSPTSEFESEFKNPLTSNKRKWEISQQLGADSPESLEAYFSSKKPTTSAIEELGNIIGGFVYKGMVEVAKIIKEDKDVDISKKAKEALTNKMISDATLMEE